MGCERWCAVAAVAGLTACGGGGGPATAPTPIASQLIVPGAALAVSTTALVFAATSTQPTSLPLTVTFVAPPGTTGTPIGAAAAGVAVGRVAVTGGSPSVTPAPMASVLPAASVADPSIVGLGGPFAGSGGAAGAGAAAAGGAAGTVVGGSAGFGFSINGYNGSESFGVVRYAAGSTTIAFALGSLTSTVAVTGPPACGRPEPLTLGTLLVAPAPGAAQVSPSTAALYAVLATPFNAAVAVTARVLAPAAEVVNTPFVAATFPPGVPVPTPVPLPGVTSGTYRADIPLGALAAGTTYRVQFVDDVCQPAFIAGSFST